MTKKQRIAELEREVKELRELVDNLQARLALVEARPIVPVSVPPWPQRKPWEGPWTKVIWERKDDGTGSRPYWLDLPVTVCGD